jgi:hypothetical protein
MVKSQQLLLLSFLFNGHIILGGIIQQQPSPSKHWNSPAITSTSHAVAIVSNNGPRMSVAPNNMEQHYPLSINLVEAAVLQVVNYGPGNYNQVEREKGASY